MQDDRPDALRCLQVSDATASAGLQAQDTRAVQHRRSACAHSVRAVVADYATPAPVARVVQPAALLVQSIKAWSTLYPSFDRPANIDGKPRYAQRDPLPARACRLMEFAPQASDSTTQSWKWKLRHCMHPKKPRLPTPPRRVSIQI